ncbi:cation:proton antiporter [Nitriliruptoraceae bacterium ZYF776]|nr:cation:proton antiporter [Profundirhabdus halotolerans]
MTAAVIVGLLAAGGTYLILQRGIVRVTLGFTLLGHAATTLLLAAGGVGRRGLPFVGEDGVPADPLPQAFALTAIVISFGTAAFLLTLAFRGRDVLGHDDVEVGDADVDDASLYEDEHPDPDRAVHDVEGRA